MGQHPGLWLFLEDEELLVHKANRKGRIKDCEPHMPKFLPIAWRLAQLIGEGRFEQAYSELEVWTQNNSGPETPSRVCRFRGIIMSFQYGHTPAVGELFMQGWRLARYLPLDERAESLADLLSFACDAGDHHMVHVARRAWFRLSKRHGEDPAIQPLASYVCSFLGFYAVLCGHPHAAVTWFDKAAANIEDLEDKCFAAWALAFSARECIKLGRFDAAASRVARAAALLPPDMNLTALIPCVQAELLLAQRRVDEAVGMIDSIPPPNSLVQVRVLVACVTARLYGALGRIDERQRWCNIARERLGQYPPAWLAKEVAMLETH